MPLKAQAAATFVNDMTNIAVKNQKNFLNISQMVAAAN